MIDTHTHSSFSMDSTTESEDIVRRAVDLGLGYIAITDHYNRDYDNIIEKYRDHSRELEFPLDLEGHINDVMSLQKKYEGKIYVGVGVECGYSRDSEDKYLDTLDRSKMDIIINSIHTIDREDIYDDIFYIGKDREYVFKRYLELIRESVDAKYPYDTIAHIGYIARKAPYENNLITYEEFPDEIDDILRAIISRDKCLECNANKKRTTLDFLPGTEILEEYYKLGGRRISYGSDAHKINRIAEHYDEIASIAKNIGFEGFTYYVKGEPRLARFDR